MYCHTVMNTTQHMTIRMAQRNFSGAMVDAILGSGEWNARGDRLTMDERHHPDLDQLLTEKRRQHKQLEKEIRDLDRLRWRGRVTLVTVANSLITVYRNN